MNPAASKFRRLPLWTALVCLQVSTLGQTVRTNWTIGENAPAGASAEMLFGEFSVQNNRNDARPGAVTRVPGDPLYNAGANPPADDDFYSAGSYPAGFNGLAAALTVPFDEPASAWERAHTLGDQTNRFHFVISDSQALGTANCVLRVEWATGGYSVNGIVRSGFGEHTMVIRFRNGTGISTPVYSGLVTAPGELVLPINPLLVQATPGANTLEFVRTGPALPGYSYWITYDYVQWDVPSGNTPPQPGLVRTQNIPELSPLNLNLAGPAPGPAGTIAYVFGDSITAGALASPASLNAWHPLVCAAFGWSLTNLAYSSATISDINWQILPGFLRTNSLFHGGAPVRSPNAITTNLVSLILTGYNDGRDGFGTPNQPGYQAFYRSGLRHAAAYLAIPSSGRTVAQNAIPSGTWIPSTLFGGGMGSTSADGESSLEFPSLSGTTLYLAYVATSLSDLGSFRVTVDGQPFGIVTSTGAFANRNVRFGTNNSPIPPNAGTNGDGRIWASPQLLRITGLPEGTHGIQVGHVAGTPPVTILWAAGSRSAREGIPPQGGPSVWVGGTLRGSPEGYLNGNDAGMAVFTQIQAEVCAELASDGLQVQHVRSGDAFDPETGMSADNVHPNNLGHAQIASSFIVKILTPATDTESLPNALSFELLEGPSGLTLSPRGTVSWIPAEPQGPGTHTVRYRVSDNGIPNQSATNLFLIQVREVNTPPTTAPVADFATPEGLPILLQIASADSDLPVQSLTFELLQGPEGSQLSNAGAFEWTPGEADGPGTFPVKIRIGDSGTPPMSVTNAFIITVSEENLAPAFLDSDPVHAFAGEPLDLAIQAMDPDSPQNLLRFERIDGPEGLTISESGFLHWTPPPSFAGTTTRAMIRVVDTGFPPLSATNEIPILVESSAQAPVLPPISPMTLPHGSQLILRIPAEDPDTRLEELTFVLLEGPEGASLSSDGLLTWTANGSPGLIERRFVIEVSDASIPPLSATNQFTVTVTEPNFAPISSPMDPIRIPEGTTVLAAVQAVDPNSPPDPLTFEVISGPSGAQISTEGVLSWTPSENQGPSTNAISIRVSDNRIPPLSTTNTLQLIVDEENQPPGLPSPFLWTVAPNANLSRALTATDPDIPANELSFTKSSGPPGLTISPSGVVQWSPSTLSAGAIHQVEFRVTDNGIPPAFADGAFRIEVSPAPIRSVWRIGENAPTGAPAAVQFAELSPLNNRNDPAPGLVTRLPGDPLYSAITNPGADDDFYFTGTYPAGFNGLPSELTVPFDEPSTAWERGHTLGDRTNRLHFKLEEFQTTGNSPLRLSVELGTGGFSIAGIVQSGFGDHDMEIRFRNGLGVRTRIYSGRISRPTELTLDLNASQVLATPGANTIEIVRTGPALATYSYWITYDYLELRAAEFPNSAPTPPAVPDQTVTELESLRLNLAGPRTKFPEALGVVFGDSIAEGRGASSPANSWAQRVAASRNWPLGNLAYANATITDLGWQVMPGFTYTPPEPQGSPSVSSPETIETNLMSLVLTGYEDGRDGFGEAGRSDYQAFYRSSLRHVAAYLSIPTSAKRHAQTAAIEGSWIPSPLYGGAMGRTAVADGATLLFTNLAGPTVYLAYLASAQNDLGEFSVSIDGIDLGSLTGTGAFGNRSSRLGTILSPTPANVGTNGDGTLSFSPMLARFAGLPTITHTLRITASAGIRPVTILWAAGSGDARAGLSPETGPAAWIGGTLRGTPSGSPMASAEGMATLTRIQSEVCHELASDGLLVQHVPLFNSIHSETEISADGITPNDLGHDRIAAAFLEKMPTLPKDEETTPDALTFSLVDGPAGLSLTPTGALTWIPTEDQGPTVQTVRIRVSDSGNPPLSATNEFQIHVQENNSPPVSGPLPDLVIDIQNPFSLQLPNPDPDLPRNSLLFSLLEGPSGLAVSSSGFLTWTPSPDRGGTTNRVAVRVSDDGMPPASGTNEFRILVRESSPRTDWPLGIDDPPTARAAVAYSEFSVENGRNDPPPGTVTRLPGDPGFNPVGSSGADDDYYFAGIYPAGFNALPALLDLPNDEPFAAWERGLTISDRTNRIHFILGSAQTSPGNRIRISYEFCTGASRNATETFQGFSDHIVEVRFRNASGRLTTISSNWITSKTNLVAEFTVESVEARPGPNTLEFVRTGPNPTGVSAWIVFDFARIQLLPPSPGASTAGTLLQPQRATSPSHSLRENAADPVLDTGVETRLVPVVGGARMQITFRRPYSNLPGSRYSVEASEDLVHWRTIPVTTVESVQEGSAWKETVQDSSQLPDEGSRYFRIRIQRASDASMTE